MRDHDAGFRRHRPGPGGRRRRGDVRTAVLAVLTEQPGHGYEIMQALEDKSGGAWRPSPGSVYPTLQQLEDEGLVRATERDGKRVFELTDAGRAEAERRLEEAGGPPWSADIPDFRTSIKGLILAYRQVMAAGSNDQRDRANEILANARRELYRLLAED
jgi:DNA-binding PadR family transcriptional regulator